MVALKKGNLISSTVLDRTRSNVLKNPQERSKSDFRKAFTMV